MKLLVAIAAVFMLSVPAFAAMAPDGNYRLDISHTNLNFEVSHMGLSFVSGRFNKFSGSFSLEANGESKVNFEIDAATVDTNNARRDKHLRSADFFDVASHPNIKFVSTTVTYDENGDPETLTGDFTMHGVTNSVTFDVEPIGSGADSRNNTRAGYRATTTIQRSSFGMDKLLSAALDDVHIVVNIEGILLK